MKKKKEFNFFLIYLFFFAFLGASFILFFPTVAGALFGEGIVCSVSSSEGMFCYGPSQGVNWPITLINWVVDLTFLFGGAFVVLKVYGERLKKVLK